MRALCYSHWPSSILQIHNMALVWHWHSLMQFATTIHNCTSGFYSNNAVEASIKGKARVRICMMQRQWNGTMDLNRARGRPNILKRDFNSASLSYVRTVFFFFGAFLSKRTKNNSDVKEAEQELLETLSNNLCCPRSRRSSGDPTADNHKKA